MFTLYYQYKIYILDNYTVHICLNQCKIYIIDNYTIYICKKIQYYLYLFRNSVNITLIVQCKL